MSARVAGLMRATTSRPRLARLAGILLGDRDRVDAFEPAVEVDVGATLGAEWPEALDHGLAAGRAALDRARVGRLVHAPYVGAAAAD
jgi:hypothetical protein